MVARWENGGFDFVWLFVRLGQHLLLSVWFGLFEWEVWETGLVLFFPLFFDSGVETYNKLLCMVSPASPFLSLRLAFASEWYSLSVSGFRPNL